MSEHKGTPGPWYVASLNDNLYIINNMEIVSITKIPLSENTREQADARLIAAAPCLLALVREIATDGQCSCDDWIATPKGEKCWVCRAKAIIKRVTTGEQP